MESSDKPITAVFYGISGAGKGTQAKLLVKYLELEAAAPNPSLYIETGEALRGFIRTEGHTQKLASEFLSKGMLLPSFLPIYLWVSALVEQFTGTEHIILDGTARREAEAYVLDSALAFYGRSEYHVFVLEISDEVALARLRSRARGDDKGNEEGMKSKLLWYKENVVPCIDAFEKMGKAVHRINGDQSIEAIHNDILRELGMTKTV
jgi:adenylate kinase family enzyme